MVDPTATVNATHASGTAEEDEAQAERDRLAAISMTMEAPMVAAVAVTTDGGKPAAKGPYLKVGRIVDFALADGSIRPAIVVQVWGPGGYVYGAVNLLVFLDGTNDSEYAAATRLHNLGLAVAPGGHTAWATSRTYWQRNTADPKQPAGHWAWPELH